MMRLTILSHDFEIGDTLSLNGTQQSFLTKVRLLLAAVLQDLAELFADNARRIREFDNVYVVREIVNKDVVIVEKK